MEFINQVYWQNTVEEYLLVLGFILVGMLIIKLFKNIILSRSKKLVENTKGNLDDYLVESIERYIIPAVYFTIIYSALLSLELPDKLRETLSVIYTVIITYYGVSLISNVIRLALRSYARKQEDGEEKVKQLKGILILVNIIIWGLGLVFLFDNLGYDVTAIITGLGIGGIAIALAAQNILGDLFNYFVIFFDRPFEIGDFVEVDDKSGTIDKIGLKTTRLNTLPGEQLVIANSDLTNSRIHNYKKMQQRRIEFFIGVSYQTSLNQLKEIPNILKEVITAQDKVIFERAHFIRYGDSSLDFEIVYYVTTPEYNLYMDIQQQINFGIYEKFEQKGILISFPTRTLYVRNATDQKFQVISRIDKEKKDAIDQS